MRISPKVCFQVIHKPVAPLIAATLVVACPDLSFADGEFGNKVLGTSGLDAGSQPEHGFYLGDRVVYMTADRLVNRYGKVLPIKGLNVDAVSNVIGISGTLKTEGGPYWSAAMAVPIARSHFSSEVPFNDIDRSGLGDIFIQPLMIGWRFPRVDVTSSYSIYAPTGQLNRKGLTQPQLSQQISVGSTVFFDDERSLRLSALTSYNVYERKVNLDLTRGDTVQIQGGLGRKFFRLVDAGLAGYALWQVAADTGSVLTPALRGQSDFAVGLGPEFGVTIPRLGAKVTARYEWELESRSRLQGQVLMLSFSMLAWRPDGQ